MKVSISSHQQFSFDISDFRNFHQAKRFRHSIRVFHTTKAPRAKSVMKAERSGWEKKTAKHFSFTFKFPRRSKLLKSAQNCFSLLLLWALKVEMLSVHNAAQNFPSFCLSIHFSSSLFIQLEEAFDLKHKALRYNARRRYCYLLCRK